MSDMGKKGFIRFKRTSYSLLSSLLFSIREFEEDMRDSRESLQPLKLQALSGIRPTPPLGSAFSRLRRILLDAGP